MNKKTIIATIAIIGIAIVVAGTIMYFANRQGIPSNSGTNDPQSSPTPIIKPVQKEKVILEYWGLWEAESIVQPLIDRYEKDNPHVTINYAMKSITQYDDKLHTRLVLGETEGEPAPDIVKIHNTWLPRFENYLYPLPSEIMASSEYSETFYPTCVADFTGQAGKIYALPIGIDGLALFYNKNLLLEAGYTEPPENWNAFVDAAKKLTKRDPVSGEIIQAGVAMGNSKNIKHSAEILSLLFLQNNINIVASDGKSVNLASPKAAETLEYYTDFVNVHQTWSVDSRWDLEQFWSGTAAMMFAPSWRAFDIIQGNSEIEFGMAPPPQIPNNPPVNYSTYWGEAVSKYSQNPTEAWKFLKYLTEASQMQEFYSNSSRIRAFGQPYSREDIGPEISNNPYAGTIVEMAPTMKSWKMGDQFFVEDEIRKAIHSVAEENGSASSALNKAETNINTRLAEILE